MKKELLSPAGDMECLKAAIHNGCDAVYLAGSLYGARAFAKNFSDEELITAIKYCHLYGVKIYVTINTLIFESEVDDFIKYVSFLYKNKVDAVLMQDIGMIRLVRGYFPNLEIHASTQLHNSNKEEVLLLKSLGIKRVVFAREMSLSEINSIDVDIEKEVFVYGALCVSYSGCCLFSSLNGGRSANKGECTGACRLPYKLYKNDEVVQTNGNYLLSMKELNTLPNIKDILLSDVKSLKIEGRMKSSYYVGYVTHIFRTLMDKFYNGEEPILSLDELKNLKLLFNRDFTLGFLFNSNDVSNIKSPNHIGVEVGKVVKITDKYIYIEATDTINQEDGIRFANSGTGMILNMMYDKNEYLINSCSKDTFMVINKVKCEVGEPVLKTIDKKLIASLEKYNLKKIPVTINASFKLNENFSISISDGINIVCNYGEKIVSAIKHEVDDSEIKRLLSKLSDTPFEVNNISIVKDDNIFVSLKSINEVRRKCVLDLINLRENPEKNITISNKYDSGFIKSDNFNVSVLARSKSQIDAALSLNISCIYVTDYDLYLEYKSNKCIFYRVPRICNNFKDFKNNNLLVCELGAINKYKDNNNLVSDYYLNCTNCYSIETLNNLGVNKVTLSVELSDLEISNIMKKNYNTELIIYGRYEDMVMKYCPLKKTINYCKFCKNSKDKFYLGDRFNNKYPIIHEDCITHIMHYEIFNKMDNIAYYKDLGIKNYRIELYDENYDEVISLVNKVNSLLNVCK